MALHSESQLTVFNSVGKKSEKQLSPTDQFFIDCPLLAGVDEAGRGALAGPVVAAAVILGGQLESVQFKDSKLLDAKTREQLFGEIMARALSVGVGIVNHKMIDQINILKATMSAMEKAIIKLKIKPECVLIDGNRKPNMPGQQIYTLVKADQKIAAVSAASIVAKVTRDRIMMQLAFKFPLYGFDRHMGYGTQDHYDRILEYGPSCVHRLSFNMTRQETLF